jgi:6-pyruvoyltetrahydropterin/6-carboxytetrahydropterin synthase
VEDKKLKNYRRELNMFYISKRMEIAGAHNLKLDYSSKCENIHGHNWIVIVHCKAKQLNHNGMVEDFTSVKKLIHDKLDHQYINDIVDFNPTAENIAKWIAEQIPTCYKVEVQESEGNIAIYEVEED